MKRVLVLFFIAAFGLGLFISDGFSEEQKKETAGGEKAAGLKIGFVDLQQALNESSTGKKAKTELEAIIKEKQAVIGNKVSARDKLREELERQAVVLSEKAKKAKTEDLERLEKEVDRLIADSNDEVQKKQREREMVILKELEGVIEKLAEDEGFTIIFPADVILYVKDEIDLTKQVIKIYDELKAKAEKKK
ncbi:MAG: OmpH family outer membrane protein [Thermodesulfovibrionales bacterium]|nr:OmpH family outer membrane protein [Thermodesulfovibrionales bacterium]